jgi:serine/threonine protein kinase
MTDHMDFTLIHCTRNEIYLVTKHDDPQWKRIYKYHNDQDSKEVEIMQALKGVVPIPQVYEHSSTSQQSPSGKTFNNLVVMEYIEGHTIMGVFPYEEQQNSPGSYVKKEDLTVDQRKNITIQLIGIIIVLHQQGIIHGDDILSNSILTADGQLYLVDFGNSYYINNPPLERVIIAPIQESFDIFNVLTFMCYMLDYLMPDGNLWKSWKAIDLLKHVS